MLNRYCYKNKEERRTYTHKFSTDRIFFFFFTMVFLENLLQNISAAIYANTWEIKMIIRPVKTIRQLVDSLFPPITFDT